jgi:L-methionine (R)-S-oxide reductase
MNDQVSKAAVYEQLSHSLRALIRGQSDFLANISNFAALLFTTLPDLNWAGFYLLRGTDLVLGPFQGKPACACIAIGDGVCGTAALKRAAVIVPDVHAFPGHIVCDEASQSEMVLPVFKDRRLVGVLDLDSPIAARFSELDRDHIQQLLQILMDGTVVPEFRLAPLIRAGSAPSGTARGRPGRRATTGTLPRLAPAADAGSDCDCWQSGAWSQNQWRRRALPHPGCRA